MKTACIALAAVVAVALSQDTKCRPPTTFEARGAVQFHDGRRRGEGHFGWAHDMLIKKSVEVHRFEEHHRDMDSWALEDYAQHKFWFEDNVEHKCHEAALTHPQQNVWEWLDSAKLLEKRTYRGQTVDVWGLRPGAGDEIALACFQHDLTRPILMLRKHKGVDFAMEFFEFRGAVTNTTIFDPLPDCK